MRIYLFNKDLFLRSPVSLLWFLRWSWIWLVVSASLRSRSVLNSRSRVVSLSADLVFAFLCSDVLGRGCGFRVRWGLFVFTVLVSIAAAVLVHWASFLTLLLPSVLRSSRSVQCISVRRLVSRYQLFIYSVTALTVVFFIQSLSRFWSWRVFLLYRFGSCCYMIRRFDWMMLGFQVLIDVKFTWWISLHLLEWGLGSCFQSQACYPFCIWAISIFFSWFLCWSLWGQISGLLPWLDGFLLQSLGCFGSEFSFASGSLLQGLNRVFVIAGIWL